MYSGTTLTNYSGNILGAHQKIDRTARRLVERLAPGSAFPKSRLILHFEGGKGPDAIKRKSPAVDEPWHFIQPFDLEDTELIGLIAHHYHSLIRALQNNDAVKSAFEAAWLSHAIVDGLTPAHHYPYEEKLSELMNGAGLSDRTSVKQKLVMPGDTRRNQLSNNWKMWGPKGLFATHSAFEMGFATVVLPLRMNIALPSKEQIAEYHTMGVSDWFRKSAQRVGNMQMYETFYAEGWSVRLARQVRRELAPAIVRAVTLTWYGALLEANGIQETS